MYTSVRNRPHEARTSERVGRVGANVVLLGLVSLFTDLSQEMVVAVLPLYLTFELRLSPLQFGLIDGMYQGATALVRLLGGVVADRRRRYKEVAALGYGVSTLTKLGLVAVSSWLPVTALLFVDRLGKGIRTAPRDALISLSADRSALGRAFGIHRALDTCGALLGPLAAFLILAMSPLAFDSIFVLSFCFGVIGLAILLLFVQNRQPTESPGDSQRRASSRRSITAILAERGFRRIVVAGTILALLTISDAFVYLLLQREANFDPRYFPLLFLGTAAIYLTLAVPMGQLADKVGRATVFVGGHLALVALYALLLAGAFPLGVVLLCLALLGVYYAATDGVLAALASSALPETVRTTGLALVTTGTAAGRFCSSIAFGLLWTQVGPQAAVGVFLAALVVVVPTAGLTLRSREALA